MQQDDNTENNKRFSSVQSNKEKLQHEEYG